MHCFIIPSHICTNGSQNWFIWTQVVSFTTPNLLYLLMHFCFLILYLAYVQIIDGETVPAEIVEGYKRYCRIARSSPATTTVCHLCIFEVELHPNGIVRTTDVRN